MCLHNYMNKAILYIRTLLYELVYVYILYTYNIDKTYTLHLPMHHTLVGIVLINPMLRTGMIDI